MPNTFAFKKEGSDKIEARFGFPLDKKLLNPAADSMAEIEMKQCTEKDVSRLTSQDSECNFNLNLSLTLSKK